MSVAVSLYPGDSHAGLLRSRIRDGRVCFFASAFVFGPCCKKIMNIGLHVKCYVTLGQGPTASGCGLNCVALFGYFAFLSAAGCGGLVWRHSIVQLKPGVISCH